jgi:hypothetical protein
MNRFEQLQRKAASAVAALTLSTFFIGAAVGPALSQSTYSPAQVQADRSVA